MDASTRNLTLAAVGGTLWAVVPTLDGPLPWVWSVAPVAPALLGFGVLECWRRYGRTWGDAGRAGAVLASVGLAMLAAGVLLRQALAGFVGVFAVAPVAAGGALALWLGSVFLSASLRRVGVVGTPGALAFVLALPVGGLVNVVLGPARLGPGPGAVRVTLGFYGAAWVGLAIRLARTPRGAGPGDAIAAELTRDAVAERPQRVVAAVVGLAVAALAAFGLLPLGVPGGTPFAGESLLLDALHAVLGTAGVLAAASGERRARSYNRLAGAAFLALAALSLVPGPASLPLTVVDLVVYVPAAVVTLTAGVAAAAGGADGSVLQSSGVDGDVRDDDQETDDEDGRADRGR